MALRSLEILRGRLLSIWPSPPLRCAFYRTSRTSGRFILPKSCDGSQLRKEWVVVLDEEASQEVRDVAKERIGFPVQK